MNKFRKFVQEHIFTGIVGVSIGIGVVNVVQGNTIPGVCLLGLSLFMCVMFVINNFNNWK